ncbi:MAG: lysophospholipid acyltransferase family protein [Nitrospiraceae bacterium]|nr:lysophospholipid acyltransferase family protein [Nitrospiraceae bacterium]
MHMGPGFPWGILTQGVGRIAGKALGLDALGRVYAGAALSCGGYGNTGAVRGGEIFGRLLDSLDITLEISTKDLARIPVSGPVVVIANHPFGMVEGIILGHLLSSVRSDLKIMSNYLLGALEEIRDMLVLVDPFGGKKAPISNLKGMRESIRWLESGGMLAVFPAGEVSHLDLKRAAITDPEWKLSVAGIIRRTGAAVLPVYFKGANGPLFQLLGLVHPGLRTLMLPQALLNKTGQKIEIRIGGAIPEARLRVFQSDKGMLDYLRMRTYIMESMEKDSPGTRFFPASSFTREGGRFEEIIPPVDAGELAREISFLPAEALLLDHGEFQVFCAEAWQMPVILREIGRLRELTFRNTLEGTGRALDVDMFDRHYLHLFLWNRHASEIAGAYRLGRTDMALGSNDKQELYTKTLFKYDRKFLSAIGAALELGRSFVRPEYQKSYSPLLLLWKGIGHYVAKNPKYKVLFGPVSISRSYQVLSKELMVNFLKKNHYREELSRLIKAKTPLQENLSANWRANGIIAKSIEELSLMISEIEPDGKDIPVLLRQYLKLGGKLLGFNLDKKFSDVLDGLILVNLADVDSRILQKYMGKKGAETFLALHSGNRACATV